MKRLFFTTLTALLLVAIDCVAQGEPEPFQRKFMIGPTAGVNLSNLIFTPRVQQDPKIGFDAGLVMRYDIGYVYNLSNVVGGIWIEFDYSQRGWMEKPKDLEEPYNQLGLFYDRTLTFVNMPIMTQLTFGKKALKLTIDMGAHFGYLISESSKSNFGDQKIPGVVTRQHEMPVENKFAWGIGGGVGTEYHFSHFVAGIRGSYVYGLGEIYGNSRSDYFGKSSEQIIAIKTYLLYSF